MDNKKYYDRTILKILIPAILENAMLMLSDMILTGYIGRLSVTEISAFGIAGRIYSIYFSIFKGFAIGMMVVFAKSIGNDRSKKEVCLLYKQALLFLLPCAVISALLIWLFPEMFLSSMTQEFSLLTSGVKFLKVNTIVYPMLAVIHLTSSIFQADGNTKTPLYIAVIGNVVSIVFGYVFILGVGSFEGLGIVGAAITNNLRIVVMFFIGLHLLFGKNGVLADHFSKKMPFDFKAFKELIIFGVPTAIGNSFWNFAALFLSNFILSYGESYFAAYQLGLQCEGFCDMMASGFLTAAASLSGKAIGSNDEIAYKKSYERLRHYCLIIMCITMLFLAVLSRTVLCMLTDKEELVSIAHVYLLLMILSQFPEQMTKILCGFIRSAGRSSIPTVIDFVGIWGVRVFLCYLASNVLHLNIIWIWAIIDLDQWTRYLLSKICFNRYRVIDFLSSNNQMTSAE